MSAGLIKNSADIFTLTVGDLEPLERFAEKSAENLIASVEKSKKITSYLAYLVEMVLSKKPYNFKIGTPLDPEKRSGHIALEHETEAVRIGKALLDNHVIPDFRPPNVIRIAPAPLYNTYLEVYEMVQILKKIMDTKEYEHYSKERGTVS